VTTLTLSHIPISESEHVYLNGVELHRSDWTYDSVTNAISTVVTGVSGDRLECRYAHNGDAGPHLDPPAVLASQWGQGTTSTAAPFSGLSPAAVVGARIFAVVCNNNGNTPTTPSGYTVAAAVSVGTWRLTVFTKVATGGETSVSVTIPGSAGAWDIVMVTFEESSIGTPVSASDAGPVANVTTGTVSEPLAVAFTGGETSGFKSGADVALDPRLTLQQGAYIGYLGLKVGYSSTVHGGFVNGWGMSGLDQVTGSVLTTVIGLSA
jgi:hypothetical protein